MAKFDFMKKVHVFPYVKPKVKWNVNKGMTVGKNNYEMYKYKVAAFKRYFSKTQMTEIFKHTSNIFLVLTFYISFKAMDRYNKDYDSLQNSSSITSLFFAKQYADEGNTFSTHDYQVVNVNNQLQCLNNYGVLVLVIQYQHLYSKFLSYHLIQTQKCFKNFKKKMNTSFKFQWYKVLVCVL